MAAVHGKGGTVVFVGTTLTNITSWTFDSSGEIADTTAMGASFESSINGLTDFTATVEVVAMTEVDTVAYVGTDASLTLTIESGKSIVATNAIMTSITETVGIDDVGRWSMSFVGNEATLTYPS